jgi:hypothetical protein
MDQQALVLARKLTPAFRRLRIAPVHVAIHEIVNHLDVTAELEFLERTLAQVLRDGGDAVALLDGEARDRKIGGSRRLVFDVADICFAR